MKISKKEFEKIKKNLKNKFEKAKEQLKEVNLYID
jgi:hypothetical protein